MYILKTINNRPNSNIPQNFRECIIQIYTLLFSLNSITYDISIQIRQRWQIPKHAMLQNLYSNLKVVKSKSHKMEICLYILKPTFKIGICIHKQIQFKSWYVSNVKSLVLKYSPQLVQNFAKAERKGPSQNFGQGLSPGKNFHRVRIGYRF